MRGVRNSDAIQNSKRCGPLQQGLQFVCENLVFTGKFSEVVENFLNFIV